MSDNDDVKALAKMAVAQAWAKARMRATESAVRARLEAAIEVTDRRAVYLPDPTSADPDSKVLVGSVTLARPTGTPVITDPEAFLAWVKEHHPEEGIEVVEQVKPLFKASILAATKLNEAPMSHYGEADIPGVEYVVGTPTLQVRPDHGDQASAAMFAALRNAGQIGPLLSLPPVEDES